VTDADIAIVSDAITRWNVIYGQEFGAVALPLRWEIHSAAKHGERPQASLNAQLVENADIVIALFWHRLGSDTGEAVSGTVEEIEEAHAHGAYVGILQCRRPVPWDADTDQLAKLNQFFQEIRTGSLILDYEDDAALGRHVEVIINRAIAERTTRAEVSAETRPEGDARAEAAVEGAQVWPRVESSESVSTDTRGRMTTKRNLRLVISNTGTELAHNVIFRLEPEQDGEDMPLEVDDPRPLEALAPGADAAYPLILYMGVAPQARCVVSWEDSTGKHENTATLRFF
jgi:hypothetical protein